MELEFCYALYPHAGDWKEGACLQEAYDHKVPVRIMQGVSHKGDLPPTYRFLEIEPTDKIFFSALKLAEERDGYILRVWNVEDDPVTARVKTSLPFKGVKKVRLDETPLEDLTLADGVVDVEFKPGEIVSLLFTP